MLVDQCIVLIICCLLLVFLLLLFFVFVFFFFQAEDGIRDVAVTGVQSVLFRSGDWLWRDAFCTDSLWRLLLGQVALEMHSGEIVTRSEERRVGKECRSRWSPCR